MTPYEEIKRKYELSPHSRPWGWWVEWHMLNGFGFWTPDYFIMGRPIDKNLPFHDLSLAPKETANAWYVFAMAGDLSKVWEILPYPLGYVAFERVRGGNRELTIVATERLRKLCSPDLTHVPEESVLA